MPRDMFRWPIVGFSLYRSNNSVWLELHDIDLLSICSRPITYRGCNSGYDDKMKYTRWNTQQMYSTVGQVYCNVHNSSTTNPQQIEVMEFGRFYTEHSERLSITSVERKQRGNITLRLFERQQIDHEWMDRWILSAGDNFVSLCQPWTQRNPIDWSASYVAKLDLICTNLQSNETFRVVLRCAEIILFF